MIDLDEIEDLEAFDTGAPVVPLPHATVAALLRIAKAAKAFEAVDYYDMECKAWRVLKAALAEVEL